MLTSKEIRMLLDALSEKCKPGEEGYTADFDLLVAKLTLMFQSRIKLEASQCLASMKPKGE